MRGQSEGNPETLLFCASCAITVAGDRLGYMHNAPRISFRVKSIRIGCRYDDSFALMILNTGVLNFFRTAPGCHKSKLSVPTYKLQVHTCRDWSCESNCYGTYFRTGGGEKSILPSRFFVTHILYLTLNRIQLLSWWCRLNIEIICQKMSPNELISLMRKFDFVIINILDFNW